MTTFTHVPGETFFVLGNLARDLLPPSDAVFLPLCPRLVLWRPVAQRTAHVQPPPSVHTRSGPIPKLNLSVLGIISNTVPDSDNKVFIGGLPYNLSEDQVRTVAASKGRQAGPPQYSVHMVETPALAPERFRYFSSALTFGNLPCVAGDADT